MSIWVSNEQTQTKKHTTPRLYWLGKLPTSTFKRVRVYSMSQLQSLKPNFRFLTQEIPQMLSPKNYQRISFERHRESFEGKISMGQNS
ncbi:hypothetical protein GIB67_024768, partial [Kingdonia uniflora]